MDPSEYTTIYTVEDRHWWYLGMARITTTLVEALYPGRAGLDILDAGCGTGAAMGYLARFGRVTGIDVSDLALGYCQARGLRRLGQASVTALPFAPASFDLVTSFDVLYHRAVGDYRVALADFHRVLRTGGRVLLRLPAYDWLRGRHDAVIHTARRFTAGELCDSLCEAGFTVEYLSYANTMLFPLAVGKRLLEFNARAQRDATQEASLRPSSPLGPGLKMASQATHSDVQPNPPWLDALLARVLFAEAWWLKRRPLPFGLTVIAVGRKNA